MLLASFFESDFDDISFVVHEHFQHIINIGVNLPIPDTEYMVYTKLKTLLRTTFGADSVPPILLLKCARVFSRPFFFLIFFTNPWENVNFPTFCKFSFITAIQTKVIKILLSILKYVVNNN